MFTGNDICRCTFSNDLTATIRNALDAGYFEAFYQRYRKILGERLPDGQ
jgi:hypothetical protein